MTHRGEPLLRGYRELIHRNEEQHLQERQERGLDLLEQRDPGPFLPHVLFFFWKALLSINSNP